MSHLSEQTFVISKEGNIFSVYNDSLKELVDNGGEIVVKRASHVEPVQDGSFWSADLGPVGGPVLEGFRYRQQALDAELDWLNENLPNLTMPE